MSPRIRSRIGDIIFKEYIIVGNTVSQTDTDSETDADAAADIPADLCADLRERRRAEHTYESLSDLADARIKPVLEHVKGECDHDIDVDPVEEDQPWRERAVMESLFQKENMYFTQMAELLGCHDETARNWVGEHDLSPEGTHHTSSKLVRQLQQTDVDPFSGLEESAEADRD